jgi:hypothetical protein
VDACSNTCGGEGGGEGGGSNVDVGLDTCGGEVIELVDGVVTSCGGEEGGGGGPCGGVQDVYGSIDEIDGVES